MCKVQATLLLLFASLTLPVSPALANSDADPMAQGLAALGSGKLQIAASLFEKAVHADPSNIAGYRNLAIARTGIHDYEGAVDALEHASRLSPKNADLHAKMAELYRLTADYQGAVEEYSKAIAIAPASIECHSERGKAALQAGLYRLALEDFNVVLKAKPDAATLCQRARLFIKFSRDANALADLNQAIKMDPKLADAYLLRAGVLNTEGHNDLASADMKMFNDLERAAASNRAKSTTSVK